MSRQIGFTQASSASEGRRKNWLGVESWKWSKMKLQLFKQLILKNRQETTDLLRILFYVPLGFAVLFCLIAIGTQASYEPSAGTWETSSVAAQNLNRCIEQTGERKTCQAQYVMQGGSLPVKAGHD